MSPLAPPARRRRRTPARSRRWTLAQLRRHIGEAGLDWGALWADIEGLVVKSVLSIQPLLKQNYR